MATTPRKGLPYFFVSWLAKYLAGDSQCLWALDFKSRFKYDKVASDFNLAAWSAEHDALVLARAAELRAAGYTVTLENENYFQLKGQSAIVAGKMDIVARKPGYAIILDGKTGQVRKSDWHQMLTYMAVLPLLWESGLMRISGEVFYKDGTRIVIEPEEVTAERKTALFDLIRRIASPSAAGTLTPSRTPSVLECQWCDISANDCPQRMEHAEAAAVSTNLF